MADLEIIMDSHDIIENKNLNSINHSDHNVKSPNRKETILLPPPPPIPIISNIYPINKSLNGGLFEL
jgi:hypothetical protein